MQQFHPDPVALSEQAKENVSAVQPSDDPPHVHILVVPVLVALVPDLDLATLEKTFVEEMIYPDPSWEDRPWGSADQDDGSYHCHSNPGDEELGLGLELHHSWLQKDWSGNRDACFHFPAETDRLR